MATAVAGAALAALATAVTALIAGGAMVDTAATTGGTTLAAIVWGEKI